MYANMILTNNKIEVKVDLDKQFKGMDGKPVATMPTIRMGLAQALYNGNGIGNTQEEKFAAYRLCNRLLNEQGAIELDKDERNMLLAAACATLTPGGFGQIKDMFNTKNE